MGMIFQFLGYAFIAVLLVGGAVLLARRYFPAWLHLARTKKAEADEYATTIDPAGQMRQAAKDAMAELKGADDAMVAADKLKAQLDEQIAEETKTVNRLRGQVATRIKPVSQGGKGHPETHPVVLEKLKRIRDVEESIAATKTQSDGLAEEYQRLLLQANKSSLEIAATMKEADRLGVQLQLGEQMVKVREQMAKYNPNAVNSKMAEMDKYRQAAKDKLRGFQSQNKVAADRAAAHADDDEDDDDVTPDTDPALASILASIKANPAAAKPTV